MNQLSASAPTVAGDSKLPQQAQGRLHRILAVLVSHGQPRPAAPQRVGGLDPAQDVDRRPVRCHHRGLVEIIPGRVMGGQVVDVFWSEADEHREIPISHHAADVGEPPLELRVAKRKLVNKRPRPFLNPNSWARHGSPPFFKRMRSVVLLR